MLSISSNKNTIFGGFVLLYDSVVKMSYLTLLNRSGFYWAFVGFYLLTSNILYVMKMSFKVCSTEVGYIGVIIRYFERLFRQWIKKKNWIIHSFVLCGITHNNSIQIKIKKMAVMTIILKFNLIDKFWTLNEDSYRNN